MDNWGDPWADHDNAQNAKSPSKAVTSPQLPTFTPAPAVLNGFLDDAGWGNEEESFGDWSTPVGNVVETPPEEAHEPAPPTYETHSEGPKNHAWDDGGAVEPCVAREENEWEVKEAEPVVAEDRIAPATPDSSAAVGRTEDTGEADTSDEEAEECGDALGLSKNADIEETGIVIDKAASAGGSVTSGEEAVEIIQHDNITDAEKEEDATEKSTSPVTAAKEFMPPAPEAKPRLHNVGGFEIDQGLLSELFPPQKHTNDLEDAPDDPIYSTAGRKAWYRLTRKQTLREFNNGNDDDNYVRVTWGISNIRTEVNKIVGRWAREDRISGTGPGARASFYWDTPAPAVPVLPKMHMRHQSVMTAAPKVPNAPNRQSLPPLSTNNKAAFDWSSPSSSINPSQFASDTGVIPSPITSSSATIQHHGPVSINAPVREIDGTFKAQTLSPLPETPVASTLISPPASKNNTSPSDPWVGLETLDKNSTSIPAANSTAAGEGPEDEDDWGEMVSSPTVSTPVTESISQATTRNNTLSTSTTPPQSVKAVSTQDYSPDMQAAPIVRLRSTVSPTSALFKANSFVPLNIEQGPIGPGILKPVNSSVRSASQGVPSNPPPIPHQPQSKPTGMTEQAEQAEQDSIHSAPFQESNVIAPEPEPKPIASMETSTPPVSATIQANSTFDAWADADLSFFDSAPPTVAPSEATPNSSALPASFQSPPRTATKPFSRSPPRNVTPPPLQPLTSATSSAQQRKAEEDRVIQDIISGFPDLSYMLQ